MNTENLHFFLANGWQNAKHKMSLGMNKFEGHHLISLMASSSHSSLFIQTWPDDNDEGRNFA